MKRLVYLFATCLLFGYWADSAPADLFIHLKFDEGSGLTADNSAGAIDGTLKNYNAATTTGGWVDGPPGLGKAYNFNGTDSCDMPLAALDPLDIAGANPTKVTVAYWKKGNNLPNDSTYPYAEDFMVSGSFLHSWASWNPNLGSGLVYQSANAGMGFSDQIGGPAPADSLNEWHHYALTKDAETGEMKTYIDGLIIGNAAAFTKKFAAPGKFDIGSSIYGGACLQGALDDFRMYNHVLTDDEIFELAMPGPAGDADFDNNNIVDGVDFLSWQRGAGDADGDTDTDSVDFGIWKSQFGGPPPITAAATTVPEPTGFTVFALGMAGLVHAATAATLLVREDASLRQGCAGCRTAWRSGGSHFSCAHCISFSSPACRQAFRVPVSTCSSMPSTASFSLRNNC